MAYWIGRRLDPSNREALANGHALLFSASDPELRPFSYGQVAMNRNKFIYGMADACFVAQSTVGSQSGTWSGAVEELKREKKRPVYVFLGHPPSEGCLDLKRLGAKVWDMESSVFDNLSARREPEPSRELVQEDLFNCFSAQKLENSEKSHGRTTLISTAACDDAESNSTAVVEGTPYGLFLAFIKALLTCPRKESDVRKQICADFDFVPAQFKHWLAKSLQDGVIVRKESLNGKKKASMLAVPAESVENRR